MDSAPLLKRIIAESHSLLLFDNAVFMSERLFALERSIESLYWVVQSYFWQGEYAHLFHMLKSLHPFVSTFPQCKDFGLWYWKVLHVWGVACIKLHKYQYAEQVFTSQRTYQQDHGYAPSAAAQAAHHYFMGLVSRRLRNTKGAQRHFVTSYGHNPFLFSAFEEACTVGLATRMDTREIFNPQSGGAYIEEHMSCTGTQMCSEEETESDDSMGIEAVDSSSTMGGRCLGLVHPTAKKSSHPTRKAPRTKGSGFAPRPATV